MVVSSSLSGLEQYLILEGRTFFLLKGKSRRRVTVYAQLCMYFQFGSSNIATTILVQQYRSCTLQGRDAHSRMEPLPSTISAWRLNPWSRYISSAGDNTCTIKKFPPTRYIEYDCGYTGSEFSFLFS